MLVYFQREQTPFTDTLVEGWETRVHVRGECGTFIFTHKHDTYIY